MNNFFAMKPSCPEPKVLPGDDAVRNPESARNHFEEVDNCSGSLVRDRYSFDPLGKLVDCDEQMSVITVSGSGQAEDGIRDSPE